MASLAALLSAHRLRAAAAKPRATSRFENRAIIFRHDARRAHHAARVALHDLVGLLEMRPRPLDQRRADFRQRRIGDHLVRIGRGDAGMQQAFARQIEPADAGVFVDVAQDIGQLQRAAEMMREQDAVIFGRPNTRTDSRPTALATRSQYRSSVAMSGARISCGTSISMPSMMARKSSRLRPKRRTEPT